MPDSFLNFLNSLYIATEAEDITQQTANEVRSALGGRSMATQDEDRKEDLMNTDDIFGQNSQSDGPSGNPEQDQQDGLNDNAQNSTGGNGQNQDPNNPEEAPENPEDPNASPPAEDPNLNETPDDATTGEDQSDDLLFAKKNSIRDNLAQLYTVIAGDIETLVSTLSNLNDANALKVVNAVLLHLRNCKDYIYKTLTVNLTQLEYDELLRRYVTIKRVYDICIKMLETHFHDNEKETRKSKD